MLGSKKEDFILDEGLPTYIRAKELSSKDKFNFEAKLMGNYIRIYPARIRDKLSIYEQFKLNNMQHYLIPDREITMEVFFRGLPSFLDMILIKKKKRHVKAYSSKNSPDEMQKKWKITHIISP